MINSGVGILGRGCSLMSRTGKRYEWEVGVASGQPLSRLFQDFDWADEVLQAQLGRLWYIPRIGDLKQALAYGDEGNDTLIGGYSIYGGTGNDLTLTVVP
jgi:hypothetical protein